MPRIRRNDSPNPMPQNKRNRHSNNQLKTKSKSIIPNEPNDTFSWYFLNNGICDDLEDFDSMVQAFKRDLPVTFRIAPDHPEAKSTIKQLLGGKFDWIRGCRIPPHRAMKLNDLDKKQHEINIKSKSFIEPYSFEWRSPKSGNIEKATIHYVQSSPKPINWYPDNLCWQAHFSKRELRYSVDLDPFRKFLISGMSESLVVRQELVSMVPPLFLDIEANHSVLDMCSSPGSKTQQLISKIVQKQKDPSLPTGLIVANDITPRKCSTLISNTKTYSYPGFVVTCCDAGFFPTPRDNLGNKLLFDRILADVPCTGSATIRKNPDVWRTFSCRGGNTLHPVQYRVASRGFRLLKPGGSMVYSTCSLNPIENEAIVARLCQEFEGFIEIIDTSDKFPGLKRRPGKSFWKVPSASPISILRNRPNRTLYKKANPEKFISGVSNAGKNYQEMPFPDDSIPVGSFPGAQRLFKSYDECKPYIKHISQSHHLIIPEMFPPPNVKKYHLDRTMRFFPQDQDTGGFFVAVLKKIKPLKNDLNKRTSQIQTDSSPSSKLSATSTSTSLNKEPVDSINAPKSAIELSAPSYRFCESATQSPFRSLFAHLSKKNKHFSPNRFYIKGDAGTKIYYASDPVRNFIQGLVANKKRIFIEHAGVRVGDTALFFKKDPLWQFWTTQFGPKYYRFSHIGAHHLLPFLFTIDTTKSSTLTIPKSQISNATLWDPTIVLPNDLEIVKTKDQQQTHPLRVTQDTIDFVEIMAKKLLTTPRHLIVSPRVFFKLYLQPNHHLNSDQLPISVQKSLEHTSFGSMILSVKIPGTNTQLHSTGIVLPRSFRFMVDSIALKYQFNVLKEHFPKILAEVEKEISSSKSHSSKLSMGK